MARQPRRAATPEAAEDESVNGAAGQDAHDDGDAALAVHGGTASSAAMVPYFTNARDGLNLRAGPGTDFTIIRSLPLGTRVFVLGREGRWARIDEQGDGVTDGFVHLSFLSEQRPGDAPTLGADNGIRDFWGRRNPRGALLYRGSGNAVVDPRLLHAAAVGTSRFETENPDYRVEIYGPGSGFRASGSTTNHGAQPGTGLGAAMDIVIIDLKTRRMLTNHPGAEHQNQGSVGDNAPMYQRYYNDVVRAGAALYPEFERMARFGGYFASGSDAMDTMHVDMRGQIAPTGGGSLRGGFTAEQMARWDIKDNRPYS